MLAVLAADQDLVGRVGRLLCCSHSWSHRSCNKQLHLDTAVEASWWGRSIFWTQDHTHGKLHVLRWRSRAVHLG